LLIQIHTLTDLFLQLCSPWARLEPNHQDGEGDGDGDGDWDGADIQLGGVNESNKLTLVSMLRGNTCVESLHFSRRTDDEDGWASDSFERLSSEGIRPLCQLRLAGLRELALSAQGIGPAGAGYIASFLASGGSPLECLVS
jgi:hypothetical protein